LYSVLSTCGTVTLRSFGYSPRALDEPIAWPIRSPPPATIADMTGDQWVAAAAVLIVDARGAAELAPHHRHHVLVHAAIDEVPGSAR